MTDELKAKYEREVIERNVLIALDHAAALRYLTEERGIEVLPGQSMVSCIQQLEDKLNTENAELRALVKTAYDRLRPEYFRDGTLVLNPRMDEGWRNDAAKLLGVDTDSEGAE